MKLAYALTGYKPSTGGAQTHFHEIARRLQARHGVEVFCHWLDNRTDWLRGVTVHPPGGSQTVADGVPVHQINFNPAEQRRVAPWAWSYYFLMGASVDRIAGVLSEKLDAALGPVDLIHAGRMGREFLAWAALRVARRRRVPFVLTPFHHPKWSGWPWRWYLKLYREADALMALTQAEKKALAGLGVAENRIHVIGHAPLDPAPWTGGAYFGAGGPVILFLGQKYAYKGLAQLLAAMPVVWRSRPDARFAFLGPRTPYSRKLFARLDDPRVIEQDRVSDAEKTGALAGCAVFCLPSRQESFGGVYAEAWAQGKPVVGGDIPAVSELINAGVDGAVVGTSPEALAGVLVDLLNDPAKAGRWGTAGQEKVRRQHTWDAVVGAVEEVYRGLVAAF